MMEVVIMFWFGFFIGAMVCRFIWLQQNEAQSREHFEEDDEWLP
jgi:hypothetical protein